MKLERIKGGKERYILTGMIVDTMVLGRIVTKWQRGMFRSKWANLIGGWCIKYYNKYGKAPLKAIEHIYRSWAATTTDKETVKLVEYFLELLSAEYEQLKKESNSKYILDLAGQYFNEVKIRQVIERAQGELDVGEVEKANESMVGFTTVELGVNEGINVFQDTKMIRAAFADRQEPLIVYPGALGEFFGNQLCRDAFISFMAPEKRGKTWWLMDIAWQAVLQRRKVAFFEVGDMSISQIMRRYMVRVARQPLIPKTIRYPIKMKFFEGEEQARVKFKTKRFKRGISPRDAIDASRRFMQERVGTKKPLLKLSCHSNSSIGVDGIANIITDWEKVGWVPDVVVIDYADILKMNYPGLEGRNCIDMVWKQLRGLSQKLHCLVVTATQSNVESYDKKTMTMKNFSEDKRKLAHVTGMVGINAMDEEKDNGVRRLNWVVLREEEYIESKCVHVAGCLALGNPAVKSCF